MAGGAILHPRDWRLADRLGRLFQLFFKFLCSAIPASRVLYPMIFIWLWAFSQVRTFPVLHIGSKCNHPNSPCMAGFICRSLTSCWRRQWGGSRSRSRRRRRRIRAYTAAALPALGSLPSHHVQGRMARPCIRPPGGPPRPGLQHRRRRLPDEEGVHTQARLG